MNDKFVIIALFGESGSGKDTIQAAICEHLGFHKIVSTTTRPPREYEREGVDYFFITPEQFASKIINLEMLEATEFREWFYGTTLSSLNKEKINVGVFNPSGIRCLLEDDRVEVIPIYVNVSAKTRLIRALNREENPNVDEIVRRYAADKKDFFDTSDEFDPYYFNNEKELPILNIVDNFKNLYNNYIIKEYNCLDKI